MVTNHEKKIKQDEEEEKRLQEEEERRLKEEEEARLKTFNLEKTKRAGFRQIRLKKHRSLPEELVESFILTNNGLE